MEKDILISKLYWLIQKAQFEEDVDRVDDSIKEEASPMKIKTKLQERILQGVDAFGKAMEEEIKREQEIQGFLKGYQRLALLSKSYSNKDVASLYDSAKEINVFKSFGIKEPVDTDRLEQVIYIDTVAHNLHQIKQDNGVSLYKQLDTLADISKSAGEKWREDRLIILEDTNNASKLESLAKMDIIQKGALLDKGKSFWRLFEKALKSGVQRLTDTELVVLREWLYSKV